MKPNKYPSSDFFNSIYDYSDGCLFHKSNHKSKRYAGQRAGRVQRAGYKEYRQVKTGGKLYYEHRVVLIMHGVDIPDGMQVDHINGCGTDNRLSNLRVVCRIKNNRNKLRSTRGSASGFTGVTYDKHAGARKWKAYIEVLGKHINLGLYATPEEAYKVRLKADEEYGFESTHGSQAICQR